MHEKNPLNIAFLGTPVFAVTILEKLKEHNILPRVVITAPDKPQGRHLVLTPPPVKVWAQNHNIPVLQPEKLGDDFLLQIAKFDIELSIVAAYGKIIPQKVLDIPEFGTLNVHPSLLPLYRGSSPIESAILNGDKETGVTIMLLDAKLDHGPCIAQEKQIISDTMTSSELEHILAEKGGELLAATIPPWVHKECIVEEQDHNHATFTQKIKKEDGHIDLENNAELNYRKIRAYDTWPRTYFFLEKNGEKIRVIVQKAHLENEQLILDEVIPEGKKVMSYQDFLHGFEQ